METRSRSLRGSIRHINTSVARSATHGELKTMSDHPSRHPSPRFSITATALNLCRPFIFRSVRNGTRFCDCIYSTPKNGLRVYCKSALHPIGVGRISIIQRLQRMTRMIGCDDEYAREVFLRFTEHVASADVHVR